METSISRFWKTIAAKYILPKLTSVTDQGYKVTHSKVQDNMLRDMLKLDTDTEKDLWARARVLN